MMIITIKMHMYLVSQQVLSKNKKSEKLVKLCLHSSESVHISFKFDEFFSVFFKLVGTFFLRLHTSISSFDRFQIFCCC